MSRCRDCGVNLESERYCPECLTARQEEEVKEKALCESIGLVGGPFWSVPKGFIAVGKDGPWEYLPGFYRRPSGVRIDSGKVFAKLVDSDGYGKEERILGIIPEPARPQGKGKAPYTLEDHLRDGD